MAESPTNHRATPVGSFEPSRRVLRLLRIHARAVEVVRAAEFDYHGAVLTEVLRKGGRGRHASDRRIEAAFKALTRAVATLQGSQALLRSLAEAEHIPFEALCALDKACEFAGREYAAYLAAQSHEQVREEARRGPFRGRRS
jgi:hypothetical protein